MASPETRLRELGEVPSKAWSVSSGSSHWLNDFSEPSRRCSKRAGRPAGAFVTSFTAPGSVIRSILCTPTSRLARGQSPASSICLAVIAAVIAPPTPPSASGWPVQSALPSRDLPTGTTRPPKIAVSDFSTAC